MASTNRDLLTDDYDLRAYEQIMKTVMREPGRVKKATSRATKAISDAASDVVEHIPDAVQDAMANAMKKALEGFQSLIVEPSFRSVMQSRVQKRYQRLGHAVDELEDISGLSLFVIDKAMPPLGMNYAITMALEGAAVGAAITGAEILGSAGTVASAGAAAGPSAGVVAGAMALDAATVLGASMRVIAHIGAYHGRDVRLPEEQAFAMSVINWSGAGSVGPKAMAFKELSKLTQELVRGAAWAQLNAHAMVQVMDKAMLSAGFDLTKRKLGQAVPVAGVAIGAGLNAQILHSTAQHARMAYRLRHLVEMYGLDTEEFNGEATSVKGNPQGAAPDDDGPAALDEG